MCLRNWFWSTEHRTHRFYKIEQIFAPLSCSLYFKTSYTDAHDAQIFCIPQIKCIITNINNKIITSINTFLIWSLWYILTGPWFHTWFVTSFMLLMVTHCSIHDHNQGCLTVASTKPNLTSSAKVHERIDILTVLVLILVLC